MSSPLTQVPPREWLAVFFPPVVGASLLAIGANEPETSDDWTVYFVVAASAFLIPIAYTAYLAGKGRLFLRDTTAADRNRTAIAKAQTWGGLAITGIFVAIGLVTNSVAIVLYAGLGGASLGFWPGILANFVRLWREQWSKSLPARGNLYCAGVRECAPNPYSSTSRAVRALLVHPGHPLARTA